MDVQPIPIVLAIVKNSRGEILMSRRRDSDIPAADSLWEFPGGKIEWGETPEEAVIREVLEETGLEVTVMQLLPKIFTNFWTKANGDKVQTIILSYKCTISGGQLHTTANHDHKVTDLQFFKLADIYMLPTLPNIKETLPLLS